MARLSRHKIYARIIFCTVFVVVMLSVCLVASKLIAQDSADTNLARQKAASAPDKSASLEERKSALKTLEDSTRVFLNSGATVEAARALNRIGRLQLILYNPQSAIESHKHALSLLKHTSSSEEEVDNLNGLAAAYMVLYKPDDAEASLRLALSLSERMSYSSGNVEALLTMSDLQNYSNHATAMKTARKALALSEATGDKENIANAYFQIGQCYMALQELPESKKSNERAYELWVELKNGPRQADALIALGQIEQRNGAWQDAISYFSKARDLLDDKTEPMRMGQICMGLGENHVASGMPEIALAHLQRGLDYFRQTQKPDFVAYAIRAIGRTQFLLGNYSEAIAQLEKSFDGVREGDSQTAEPHEWLARVYIAMADYDVALDHLKTALPIYERAVNPMEVARVKGLIGQVYQLQGDSKQALQFYKQSLDGFTRLDDRVNLAVIYFALGRLELDRANLEAAETYLRQSIEVTEDMRRASTNSDLTVSFSATVQDRYESYVECLMLKARMQPGQGFDARAFETNELSHGRALAEVLQATQTAIAPGLDPQLAMQEKSLRQSLRVKEDSRVSLLSRLYKKEDVAEIDRDIAQLKAEYNTILESIRARYPSFEQIQRPTGWNVREIQEKVIADDDTVLLEYSLGGERSYVWAVTRNRITSYELPSEASINEAAQKIYKLLATSPNNQPTKDLDQATQELSQMVLSPVAADLNKRRVLIVADGALNYIPFQVLLLPTSNREQLLVAHEVINAPSASILGQLRQETVRRQPATNMLAAFGDPVFASNYAQVKGTGSGELIASAQSSNEERMRAALRDVEISGDSFDPSILKPLFYAKHELANLREVAGDDTLLATGFDASRERLQHTDLTRYSILHFATHGVLNPKRPENSGLILSTVDRNGLTQDGFVGLSDIYNLRAPVDLVVLSACRTGLGKDVRGEGLIGITRGFMYAGASSVVASLWKVDDEATAELMKHFYINLLKEGMTPAAALAAAQNSIRQQPRWSSPYYWAAFTIQGDFRGVIKPPRATNSNRYENMIAGASFLVLMAIVAWSYRRHKSEISKASV